VNLQPGTVLEKQKNSRWNVLVLEEKPESNLGLHYGVLSPTIYGAGTSICLGANGRWSLKHANKQPPLEHAPVPPNMKKVGLNVDSRSIPAGLAMTTVSVTAPNREQPVYVQIPAHLDMPHGTLIRHTTNSRWNVYVPIPKDGRVEMSKVRVVISYKAGGYYGVGTDICLGDDGVWTVSAPANDARKANRAGGSRLQITKGRRRKAGGSSSHTLPTHDGGRPDRHGRERSPGTSPSTPRQSSYRAQGMQAFEVTNYKLGFPLSDMRTKNS